MRKSINTLSTSMRSHSCGQLGLKNLNKSVILCGWTSARRDHGGVIFIDLRDKHGITQIVFNPKNKKIFREADKLKREHVVRIKGKVKKRPKGTVNKSVSTGQIEVIADSVEIINPSKVPPFEIEDRIEANEDLKLEYRYLDLRRPKMQKIIALRHAAAQATRQYLNDKCFLEIETPLLMRSTPEGARDYIVPSRIRHGKFYALPQSPQLYKQILMVSGCDRYYQLAKCLRDEDLRADRQPEFTQVDIEMSFIDENDIYELIEGLFKNIFKKTLSIDIKIPFPRITYKDAMNRYGSDKPDIRFKMELIDVSDAIKKSDFTLLKDVLKQGGIVKGIVAKGGGTAFSKRDINKLTELVKIYKAKGLISLKLINGKFEGPYAIHFAKIQKELVKATGAKDKDIILLIGDKSTAIVNEALGQLRLGVAKRLNMIPKDQFKFVWVVDFPLFEWNEDEGRWAPKHHIFSMPKKADIAYLEKDPKRVKGKLYDIVLNGTEVGGGSIRIHKKDIQEKVLKVIGHSYEDAEKRFGFLLKAFQYGACPHGGIALGFDRIVQLLCGLDDIRDVIAFPKNKAAECPMDESPSDIDEKHLKELGIKLL